MRLELAVTSYVEDEMRAVIGEAEELVEQTFTEWTPSLQEFDDGPTTPVHIDLDALRRSVGTVVIVTR